MVVSMVMVVTVVVAESDRACNQARPIDAIAADRVPWPLDLDGHVVDRERVSQ